MLPLGQAGWAEGGQQEAGKDRQRYQDRTQYMERQETKEVGQKGSDGDVKRHMGRESR